MSGADSPGSPLSELSSQAFEEDDKTEDRSLSVDTYHDAEHESVRPTKRQRTGPSGLSNYRASSPEMRHHQDPDDIYISEDTEGSVPASPNHPPGLSGMQDEESLGQDQVTVCKWDGCNAGDLGNMDKLVDHLHDDHIGTRQKKYSCEWSDCARKGIPHASGYALRAHMRSHTREKPFYCTLPECDRAFTRSDALAKHMRTVHETEALRPSDPVPKHHSSNPSNKAQRLRLVFKNGVPEKAGSPMPASPMSQANTSVMVGQHGSSGPVENEYEHNNIVYRPADPANPNGPRVRKFPADIEFTEEELAISPDQLVRLLARQCKWAHQEGESLRQEIERLEKRRLEEWISKELLLENVMEAEELRMERVDRLMQDERFREIMREDIKTSKALDVQPRPNWRDLHAEKMSQKERDSKAFEGAAGVLAGLAGAHASTIDRDERPETGDTNQTGGSSGWTSIEAGP
ncbi:hypothetical protein BKA80DRAFT_224822 [Phyllosticta citrichinensis]